jgi:hypothetical protein
MIDLFNARAMCCINSRVYASHVTARIAAHAR